MSFHTPEARKANSLGGEVDPGQRTKLEPKGVGIVQDS